MKGLYMADGSFMPFVAKELSVEIASRQNASLFGYEWFGQLPDPDPILRKKGDDVQVLSDLSADEQVLTAMTSRKNRVLNSQEYGFKLASLDGSNAETQAKKVYGNLIQDLERTNLRSLVSSILDAPFYGLVPLEIMWEATGSWWRIKDIVARPYHWFAFDENNKPFFKGEYNGIIKKEYLPAGKFVMVTYNATYDNPYGTRLLSRCLWAVAFKHGGMKFYAKFIEKFGMPWVIGKASAGATQFEKREIAANLSRMIEDAVAVIPKGAEVDLIAPNATATAMHEDFISRQDRTISKVLMGQTLTLEMEGKNNSQAAATTHHDVANDIAEADKALVCEAMNEIAWLYTLINAGENIAAPIFAFQEPKNLLEQASLDKELHALGVRFNHQHFVDEYGLKEDEFILIDEKEETEKLEKPTEKVSEESDESDSEKDKASFSTSLKKDPIHEAAKYQKAFDGAVKEILPEALKANKKFLDDLQKSLQRAESYEEMEYALIEALGSKMDMSELEEFLATSITQAELYGLYSNDNGKGE